MEKYFCTGRDCKMNKIFEELINELNQSISENEKLADTAHEKGDMGLAGYHRGVCDSNRDFALKLAKLIPRHHQIAH
ncbi:TPA: glyoxalase [Bacillus cereus]|uniref:glyoxalase n=2 Tax=Bacillaceae TaxID=186817 RepID=UPI0012B6A055|nr:glyoxalase [Bacillus cereus]HDR3902512.1 glyoxalase [Bacillus cereus]